MKKVILIICCALCVVYIVGVLISVIRKDEFENDYSEYVESIYSDTSSDTSIMEENTLAELIQEDTNVENKLVVNNIEELFDYYICLYIRSALREYLTNCVTKDIQFEVSEELMSVDGNPDRVLAEVYASNGDKIVIDMDREKDTWVWFVR